MRLLASVLLGVAACTVSTPPPITPPPEPDSPWESSEVVFEDDQIIVEKVSYRVDGLRIFGEVCRPRGEGPFPLLVVNHGGFSGTGDNLTGTACASQARNGFVTILSSYRGEDGSDGRVEMCLGEVDDVLEMLRIAQTLPFVDAERSLMSGGSHGGCITLRAVQRGVPVAAAVALVPPTDWALLYEDWLSMSVSDPNSPEGQLGAELVRLAEEFIGGSPDELPEEYAARSPIFDIEALNAWPGALFIASGGEDIVVPASQGCSLAAAAEGVLSFRVVAPDGTVSTEPPAACANEGVPWLAGPKPTTSWPDRRYFVFYDGADHALQGPNAQVAVSDVLSFLFTHLPL